MLIDSHAHLTDIALLEKRSQLLERAQQAGIEAIINICTSPEEAFEGLALFKDYPWIYHAASTTPHDAAQTDEKDFTRIECLAHDRKLIAIGETGLDYHYYPETHDIQKFWLRRYLNLAKACQLPVIIHCRDAFNDLFEILDAEFPGGRCVLHCFTGTIDEAKQAIERGWYLSFSGIVTFKKSHLLQEVARNIPLSHFLIETDAPYLAPMPHRGRTNEPSFLLDTARFLANLRGIDLETFAAATTQNARAFFQI
jgi:TatD DNase family protein